MWKPENYEEFIAIVDDLLKDPQVLALRDMDQHNKHSNRLDHSIYVAYLSFLFCRRAGLDYVAAARGGLLHDFHFDDKDTEGVTRLWRHPHKALANAKQRHQLNEVEEDIIVKHMWPLTRPLPRHRETFVVSMADKLCAVMEFSLLYRAFRVKLHLTPAFA